MRVRRGIMLLLALSVLALSAGPAAAAPDNVPPDNSGAAQYTESLPGAEGNQASKDLNQKQGKGKQGSALSKKEAKRLKALGKEGAAAARLAAAAAAARKAAAEGDSGSEQVVGATTGSSDSGGTGLLLPLLALLAVAALGFLAWRIYSARA